MINGGNDGIFGNDIIRIIKIEKKQTNIYISGGIYVGYHGQCNG